ncbi:MAG: glycerol-3-phosphate 1-O-acyltransferase PlsY [Clostridia bacterium]|nr:glycerol-3-phosphate 1-O-acyltransferase PlsY [Clostridia bacterium]
MVILAFVTVLCAYLIGSINFAVIFSSIFLKKDVRKMGSGNAGTTNVMRTAGFLPGALTFVCDALKGFVASYIGYLVFDYISHFTVWSAAIYGAYACGTACMLGHVFPIFYQFKGGKGVATSVGIFAVCCPIAIVIGLIVFAIVTVISKYVSLASITATVTVVTLSIVFRDMYVSKYPQIFFVVAMGAIVILKHSENIKRLLKGTENKIGKK